MMRGRWWYVAGFLLAGFAARGEAECFRTVSEAAAQVGVRDESGFRLVRVSGDIYGGKRWAQVRSCQFPERPAVLVAAVHGRAAAGSLAGRDEGSTKAVRTEAASGGKAILLAGTQVKVVSEEAMVRLEMTGVAMESGAAGQLVKVRLVAPGQTAEQFAIGIVRSAELVEMVR